MTNAKDAGFDLGALDTIEACNKAAEIEIKHPVTMVGTGVFIKLVGKDSDVYRGRIRAMADESLRRQAAGKSGTADASIDKLEQKNIDALVAATVGWRTGDEPSVTVKGDKLDFNAANARRVYTQLLPVREQVAEAINDLANFFRD
jgi:hypothetical protein